MPFATSLDTWLIASAWMATNSFGLNMGDFGVMSFWVVPLAYVATLFHHAYLFRDLRRDPSVPIRSVYKFLFPCLMILWIGGGLISVWTAIARYHIDEIRGGVFGRDMVAIDGVISAGMAWIEAGLLVIIWTKASRFKSNVRPSQFTNFDKA